MKSALKRTLGVTAGAFALALVAGGTPAFASANGCHSSACVHVDGSAHYVKWSPLSTYYNNGTRQTYYKVPINKNWPNGTDVCVQAFVDGTASNGTACVTVHN
jgi:hypothetical protein